MSLNHRESSRELVAQLSIALGKPTQHSGAISPRLNPFRRQSSVSALIKPIRSLNFENCCGKKLCHFSNRVKGQSRCRVFSLGV
jgi:hypothetical protein